MNGPDLLTAYRSSRSEGAFTELVRRYTNLVYSVAQRRLANNPLAEEVAQTVFLRLAQAAPKVSDEAALVGWLHRTTVHVAIDVWRSETRRRTREQQAAVMEATPADDARLWSEMAPQLDEALDQLSEEDREAVLLRFFAQKRMREVGQALGVSEDAAKMRVSRAVDRLRERLALRGVSCTAAGLAGLMAERSVEAAPAHLLPRLLALKLSTSAGSTGTALLLSNAKLAVALAALLGVGLWLVAQLRSPHAADRGPAPDTTAEATAVTPAPTASPSFPKRTAPAVIEADTAGLDNIRLVLHVVDAETGAGLPNARVRAAYFYAGGVPEGHSPQTDLDGTVAIPEPDKSGAHGMNIFVAAEGFVPKCLSWDETNHTNHTMRLDPALSVAGTVVDEQNQPVVGVNISIQGPGINSDQRENVAFNGGNSEVTTDASGRWVCPYVPRAYEAVTLILTCNGYTVTHASVPVGKAESMNATLVIKRGFTVTGRVLDPEGLPVANATVRELHNLGQRKQSTLTASDGTFTLQGVVLSFPNEPKMNLIVQAKGFAPQIQTVQCTEPRIIANVALTKASVFRGRVVDETGTPIPSATIRTDCGNDGLDKYKWLTQADAEGRFEWDSAPAESVLFWFEAEGFDRIRDLPLLPDGSDHEIKLTRNAKH
ncbi:MAG: sigma-70 family RNA polymerase sigma factor [Verrucomicrobia bacterium]|nr:sigma-70 family RNA polymerase sigma factor [Verrucomicrobiota bacterium]